MWIPYPIFLHGIDAPRLRLAIGRAQALIWRAPGAGGAGNPTKRIELQAGIPSMPNLTAAELAHHLSGGSTASSYWAFVADPQRYRISEAVRALDYDLCSPSSPATPVHQHTQRLDVWSRTRTVWPLLLHGTGYEPRGGQSCEDCVP